MKTVLVKTEIQRKILAVNLIEYRKELIIYECEFPARYYIRNYRPFSTPKYKLTIIYY